MKTTPAPAPQTGANHLPNPVRPIRVFNTRMATAEPSTAIPMATEAQCTTGAYRRRGPALRERRT